MEALASFLLFGFKGVPAAFPNPVHTLPCCTGGAIPARLFHSWEPKRNGNRLSMIKFAAPVIFFLAGWTHSAQADFSQEVRRCNFGGSHPDIRIAACTRNIQSGRFTGQNLAIAFSNRGLAYKKSGQEDKAIADFSEAIRLIPDFVYAFNNRGNVYYFKGQLDQAIKDFNEAIRLKPDLAEAFSNRGNVYRRKGQFDRAIKDYDKAIHLNPDDGQGFANRGLAFEKKGELNQAMRDFKKAYTLGFYHQLLLKKLRSFDVLKK